jgi:hypothetical protein
MNENGGTPSTSRRYDLPALAEIALPLLPRMLADGGDLFSHKTLLADGRYQNRGRNPLYSAMALAGLLSRSRVPSDAEVPVGRILDALHAVAADAHPGMLGNLLWVCGLAEDARGEEVVDRLEGSLHVERLDSAALGQVLKGLSAAVERFGQRNRIGDLAAACAAELLGRFSPSADLFRGQPRHATGIRSAVGQRVTSFAAQVYPLHGLAAHFQRTGVSAPAALARVADRLVEAQGPLGQWWWLYSTVDGTVLEGYPVYSVHQDGMAYMGLVPLEELGEGSYGKALDLGLDWLSQRNELSISLVDRDPPFICRNIQRAGSDADAAFGISRANYARVLARSLRPRTLADRVDADPGSLEPLRECRSYHIGWLLYADALRGG